MAKRKTIDTVWTIYLYDVRGNKAEGYEVKQCRRYGDVRLRLRIHLLFNSAEISMPQLGEVFGTKAELDVGGDDLVYFVNRAVDGYPFGELRCASHQSLNPIRK